MESTNYHNKYIKYKLKYISLQNQQNGGACKKLTDEKYKKRPSPPYHANDCKDKIMNGNDQSQYISREDLNGIYHWKKLKSASECKSAEEYYSQLKKYEPKYDKKGLLAKLDLVKGDLLKSKIYLIYIGWDTVWDFIDNAWDDAIEILVKKLKVGDYDIMDKVSFLLYTDHRIFWSTINGEFHIQHNVLKKDKQTIIDIFKKHFGKSFVWPNQSVKKTITIKLSKL